MSSDPFTRQRYRAKYTEICIGNIGRDTEPNTVQNYFQQYGNIVQCNFTSTTGGFVFISYENPSMVNECMARRPHYLNDFHLFVKRALPVDDEHPRERFDSTRDLMIVLDIDDKYCDNDRFLADLRECFSSYGRLDACKYSHESNFTYIYLRFADQDQVDRIILDKPHYYKGQPLKVMKCIQSNIEIMNAKYSSNKRQPVRMNGVIDGNQHGSSKSLNHINKTEPISETDLEKEVYRLQNMFTKMNEDFALQRRQLEDDCSEQLKKLNEDVEKTHRLRQELEREYAALSTEYESTKHENETLNDQYVTVELENFEISSYYEQILAEEKAKTIQLESDYIRILKPTRGNPSSPSKSQLHSAVSTEK